MMESCGAKAIMRQESALDSLCLEVLAEARNYEERVDTLKCILETPRPACCETCEKTAQPQTVQDQLGEIIRKLNGCNREMLDIFDRLRAQVGELKILP